MVDSPMNAVPKRLQRLQRLQRIAASLSAVVIPLSAIGSPHMPGSTLGSFAADPANPQPSQPENSLVQQANKLQAEGKFKDAIVIWQQVLQQAQTANDRALQKLALFSLGNALKDLKDYPAALAYYDRAKLLIEPDGNPEELGRLWAALGFAYRDAGQLEQAIPALQKSVKFKQQAQDRFGVGVILRSLGRLYEQQRNYSEAIAYYQRSLDVFVALKDFKWQGFAWNGLGRSYNAMGQRKQAIAAFQKSLQLARQQKDIQGEADILTSLGITFNEAGQPAKAVEYLQPALGLHRSLKSRVDEARILVQLGSANHELGQNTIAIDQLNQGLALAEEIGNSAIRVNALTNLGIFYLNTGNPQKALTLFETGLQEAKKQKNLAQEQNLMSQLGVLYSRLGEHLKAIEYMQGSRELAKTLGDQSIEAAELNNIGTIYYGLGQYRLALDHHFKSLELARKLGDRQIEGFNLGSIGIIYRAVQDYEKAIQYAEECLKIARELKNPIEEATTLLDLGLAYRQIDLAKSTPYFQQALALAEKINHIGLAGKARGNLATNYFDDRNYQQAAPLFQKSVEIAVKTGDLREQGVALTNLGHTLFRLKQYSAAEKALQDSIAIWEIQRAELNRTDYRSSDRYKISLFERQRISYRLLQQVLVADQRPEMALETAERGRARALIELVARKHQGKNAPEIAPPTIERMKQTAKALNATLVFYSLISDDLNDGPKPEYGDAYVYIWVVSPEGMVTFRQSDIRPLWQNEKLKLNDLVLGSRQLLGARGRSGIKVVAVTPPERDSEDVLKALHQILIKPIQAQLPEDENASVIIIPQGFLFTIPFAALQDEQNRSLIEQHTLLTAPSIQALDLTLALKKSAPSTTNAIVVGNPAMPKIQVADGTTEVLDALPGAEAEAKAIAQVLNTQPLIGAQARKSEVLKRLPKASIIHFATHGLLDDFYQREFPGAIALAPDQPQQVNDGLLTTDEMLNENFSLSADLVVLSACDTGRGRITGDGVVGLSRSLIAAGVPSVVVSLWAVSDNSTSDLMRSFYRNLQSLQPAPGTATNLNYKAQALRRAMLETKQKYPAPYHWAAFTLIGRGF
ncbi:CHAT domain-containing protein [Alkalinema sp. FACHB-956]|uniref:CHAT domain-containing protein n=1 Tax=Alkalinema sp. FACHB-956 TaxID=2692768 RepID=UPI0016873B90|nr:CHAT domain-containing protein [Alkalinema sp. FACHB-956]MBD2326489.1 CHAT domain-containing protein [Alkalinema sp. FACHB-956]